MNSLEELMSLCNCGIEIVLNGHKIEDESIVDYIGTDIDKVGEDELQLMVDKDTVTDIHISHPPFEECTIIYGYNTDQVIETAILMLKDASRV